jgi:protein phosphatase
MKRVDRAHMHVAAGTHPGRSGKNNEDSFGVSAYQLDDGTPSVLAVIADGIGGHRAGEVAAELAVDEVSQVVAGSDGSHPQETLTQAFGVASQRIFSQSKSADGQHGMGATCACAWVIGKRLYTAYVGDSRVYLVRGQAIQQLTVDHTWIQEALEKGVLDPAMKKTHPNLHVIRRYVGSEKGFPADFRLRLSSSESDESSISNQGTALGPGDLVLLTTDGLTDLLEEKDILVALGDTGDLHICRDTLIAAANARGGHDNITVILLKMPG